MRASPMCHSQPPFAIPVLVALGSVSWWQFAASAALSIACTGGVVNLATSRFRRSILQTDRRVLLRQIFAGADVGDLRVHNDHLVGRR
jgi:hypothetical protein